MKKTITTFIRLWIICITLFTGVSKAQDISWMFSANIYEVNTRIYTDSGTFKAFGEYIPRLKSMNADVLCFLPVHPIGVEKRIGNLGNFYSVSDHSRINPEFGTMDDFKKNVNLAHDLGMKVIIDWVGAYTSFDHVWVKKHADWYQKDKNGKFVSPERNKDVILLDYNKKEVRAAMLAAMKFWLKETGIDGFRCHKADIIPLDFWQEVRTEFNKIRPVFLVADAELASYVNTFDVVYSRSFYNMVHQLNSSISKKDSILNYVLDQDSLLPIFAKHVNFINSYESNAFSGSATELLEPNYYNFLVLSATLQGMPMIATGQELKKDKRYVAHEDDKVDWSDPFYFDKIKRLLELRHQEMGLWAGSMSNEPQFIATGSTDVIAFIRENRGQRVLVVLNFSSQLIDVSLNMNAMGRNILDEGFVMLKADQTFKLQPFSPMVLRLD